MSKNKKQQYEGVVYSTDNSFEYQFSELLEDLETLPNQQQQLSKLLNDPL